MCNVSQYGMLNDCYDSSCITSFAHDPMKDLMMDAKKQGAYVPAPSISTSSPPSASGVNLIPQGIAGNINIPAASQIIHSMGGFGLSNPYITTGTSTGMTQKVPKPSVESDFFVEFTTERIYRISEKDYDAIYRYMSGTVVIPSMTTISLEEKVIDFHVDKEDGTSKKCYKYNPPIIRSFQLNKILWIFTEPK